MPRAGYKHAVGVLESLAAELPRIRTSASVPDRLAYGRDLWPRRLLDVRAGQPGSHAPLAVAWPESTNDVVALVRFARKEGVALVPFGAGSGVCGGVDPDARSLVVDVKRLRDFRIDPDAPLLDVGAGAMGITLEEDVARAGFTIGHFPSSILCSTVGGWIAARGAGQCSGRYGKIEDMVASLECVLGTGEVVEMHRRFTGPCLVPLVIGSEGTLGIVTRAKLRLHPAPRARAFSAFSFPSTEAGWDVLRRIFQAGLRPAVSRLYDPIDSAIMKSGRVRSGRRRSGPRSTGETTARLARGLLSLPKALNFLIQAAEGNVLGGATMVLVFEGSSDEVHADSLAATQLALGEGGRALGEGPAQKWFAHRYSVSYRQAPVFRLGAFSDTMEVAAPWSRLGALYDAVREALGEHVLVMAHLSHAYPDGCSIYFTFSGAADSDALAIELYERAWRAALGAAIEAGGTLSHHHGVGRSKAPRLGQELGHGVELIRRVLSAWDPDGRMNPGNLLPRADAPVLEPAGSSGFLPGDVDESSLLATCAGSARVGSVVSELARRGFVLDVAPAAHELSVAEFVARGMPGGRDAWADPVWQPLAGFVARLHDGKSVTVRPAPRRAVGPDLAALFVGAAERIGHVEQATFLVERRGAPRARQLPFAGERNPALGSDERAAFESIVARVNA